MSGLPHAQVAPLHLWGSSPQDALQRAVIAQPAPWPQLLRACHDRRTKGNTVDNMGEDTEGTATLPAAVVAGIVLSCSCSSGGDGKGHCPHGENRFLCVSLGSGTRCVGYVSEVDGSDAFRLLDGHAEVMARRGFVAFLLSAAEALAAASADAAEDGISSSLSYHPFVQANLPSSRSSAERTTVVDRAFGLREGVQVHLVCTEWMCGSMTSAVCPGRPSGRLILRTPNGALSPALADTEKEKSCSDGGGCTAAEGPQAAPSSSSLVEGHCLGEHFCSQDADPAFCHCARVKPGKGRVNLNMSCTDKLWRWCTLGLQGRRRSMLFRAPIRITAVHVAQVNLSSGGAMSRCISTVSALAALRARGGYLSRLQPPYMGSTEVLLPQVSVFDVNELVTNLPIAANALCFDGDSCLSRGAWMSTVYRASTTPQSVLTKEHVGTKRTRDISMRDMTAFPKASSVSLTWLAECIRSSNTASQSLLSALSTPTTSCVLNTKAGLPQGASVKSLQKLFSSVVHTSMPKAREGHVALCLEDVAAEGFRLSARFPLSRAWMASHVLLVSLFSKATLAVMATAQLREKLQGFETGDAAAAFLQVWVPMLDAYSQIPSVVGNEVDGGSMPFWLATASTDGIAGTAGTADALLPHALLWVRKKFRHQVAPI